MRPGKRMHSPSLTSPSPNLWSSFTFWTHCLAASWLPEALLAHSPDTDWDLIGRDRKCKHHGQRGQVQQEREREHKQNRGWAQHARCAKMPALLSRKSARLHQWNKRGLTGVRQSSCSTHTTSQVQPDTFPLPCTRCRPLFHLPCSHLQLSSQVVPFALFLIFYLLSIVANLLFLWRDAVCTKS